MKVTEFLSDIGRPVAFHPGLKKITKSTTATLFLCQLIYWNGKQSDPDGWIYKTSEDIEDETGLTYDEQVTARKQLVKLGFIEEKYKRLDHKMVFRVMTDAIDQEWRKLHDSVPETGDSALGKDEPPHSLNSNTENTTQTTAEKTTEKVVVAEPQQPDIYTIYEHEIGCLTPLIAEMLEDIDKTYPAGWFMAAVKEAKRSSTRVSLKYVESILKRLKADGFSLPDPNQPKRTVTPTRPEDIILPDCYTRIGQ